MPDMRSVVWNPGTSRFEEVTGPLPEPGPQDLLVEVSAAALNPVDGKTRARMAPGDTPRPLGFDACGRVAATGAQVTGFAPGDRVWYAGAVDRPGSNATHQLVDARIVARAPDSLSDADAAAIPLTALTAWEGLFERLALKPLSPEPQPERLLVINGAGGVGSVLLQLAKLSGIHATATASRAESVAWCRKMGAAEVLDHKALPDQPEGSFDRIFCAHDTDAYFPEMARLVAPQGRIVSIVGAQRPFDMAPLFQKSASFGWEYMFTRPVRKTPDIARQGEILAEVARLFDDGSLTVTRTETLEGLSVENVEAAHAWLDKAHQGKLVIAF